MERKWMYGMNVNDPEFVNGVQSFLIAAESNRVAKGDIEIFCPCSQCKNFVPHNDIKANEYHLLKFGFVRKYTCWSEHVESLVDNSTSSHVSNANEKNDSYINEKHENLNEMLHDLEANGDIDQEDLQKVFDEAEKPVYDGCKNFSILSAVLELLKLKASSSWSDSSFTKLLHFLHRLLPENNELPISTYQAKKIMCPMGLEIERIHAYLNDCMLYRTESPTCLGSSCVSDGFDDLEVPTPCDLLWPYHASECHRVAIGKVYPTRGVTPHGSSMSAGYIKVQVDMVEDAFKAIHVPKATEKVHHLEDSVLEFIEWAREKIKIHQTISPCHTMSRSSPGPTMPCQTPISDLSSSSCYRPQMEEDEEEHLMTLQHQMPSGGYMNLLKSQVKLHPQSGYPPTSWPQMVEQTMLSHSASERVKPRETEEERVQKRIVKLEDRPKAFKDSLRRFLKCNNRNIPIVAPKEMYAKPWNEWIEYEAIVDLHVEGKVDISFIHWWAMHLHSVVNGLRENKFTFLNPHLISSGECLRNDKQFVNHILETRRLNLGKEIYVAPYLKGRHWLLFVVCPNLRAGYIVDSAKDDNEINYYFPEIVERAFEIKFNWTMAKCFQQKGDWECGII